MAQIAVTLLLDEKFMGVPVELTDGSRFPRWVEAWATVDDTPVTLTLEVEDGRPVLNSFLFGRPRGGKKGPLTASMISKISVDQVVRKTIEDVGRFMARVDGVPDGTGASALRSHGRRSITDSFLREVASVVRDDLLGEPNQAVQRRLHTSSRNASRWITAARERGFLTDTTEED